MCIGMCICICKIICKTSIDPTFETVVRSDNIPNEKHYKKSRHELSKTAMKKMTGPDRLRINFEYERPIYFLQCFSMGIVSDLTLA